MSAGRAQKNQRDARRASAQPARCLQSERETQYIPTERSPPHMSSMFMLLAGGLLIIIIAVVIAVVASVVSAVAADTDDTEV